MKAPKSLPEIDDGHEWMLFTRNLVEGDVVRVRVTSELWCKHPAYLKYAYGIVQGGFGMQQFSMGNAVFVMQTFNVEFAVKHRGKASMTPEEKAADDFTPQKWHKGDIEGILVK